MFKIFTDAGHGGTDPGAVSGSFKEKDLTLKITQKLNAMLQNNFEIQTSRDNDTFINLNDRARQANLFNADIFVSIHINSSTNFSADGIETLVFANKGTTAKLAEKIHSSLISETKAKDRGICERPELYVLKHTKMPAVLLELGFISNENERKKLFDSKYQDDITNAIYSGILAYFGIAQKNTNSDFKNALQTLKNKGIINSPEYWESRENIDRYFSELIIKIAQKI